MKHNSEVFFKNIFLYLSLKSKSIIIYVILIFYLQKYIHIYFNASSSQIVGHFHFSYTNQIVEGKSNFHRVMGRSRAKYHGINPSSVLVSCSWQKATGNLTILLTIVRNKENCLGLRERQAKGYFSIPIQTNLTKLF